MNFKVRRCLLSAIIFFTITNSASSQTTKTTENLNQIWLGYFNQTQLSNKWGLWGDFHLRTKDDFTNDLSQTILRVGLTYYLNQQTKLTAGYAYVTIYPADNHKQVSQPEHRPWQQIQWHNNYKRLRMMQWVRLEERFKRKIQDDSTLAPGYNFNYRIRYNIFLAFPLSKNAFAKNSLAFVVNDELHVNFGKEIVYNYFDQNRFFLGFAYYINPLLNVQLGYMNLFQQLAAGNKYKNINAIRLFVYHNIDLRKR
ncbi:MAG: DUF2490 domain-containing protein [Bacteroidetes bacterium]|nr:MAG: DUF2490 domain-containing protein [Bacteroidota bacterium]